MYALLTLVYVVVAEVPGSRLVAAAVRAVTAPRLRARAMLTTDRCTAILATPSARRIVMIVTTPNVAAARRRRRRHRVDTDRARDRDRRRVDDERHRRQLHDALMIELAVIRDDDSTRMFVKKERVIRKSCFYSHK
jgi:hypothetical protein